MVLILCVDDLLACGPDPKEIKKLSDDLRDKGFALSPQEEVENGFHFLGI